MSAPKHKYDEKPTDKAKKSPSPRFNDVEFVTWTLDSEQRAACKGWLTTLDEMDDALLKLGEEGYKMSWRWDAYNDCWGAFLTPEKDAKENTGFILTGRGSTPLKAAKQVAYVHWFVFDRDWGKWHKERKNEPLDD